MQSLYIYIYVCYYIEIFPQGVLLPDIILFLNVMKTFNPVEDPQEKSDL